MKTKNIVTGSIELLVLLELAKKDRYSYDIQKELKKDSNGIIDIAYIYCYNLLFCVNIF